MDNTPNRQSAIGNRQSAMGEGWTIGGLLDWTARFLAKKGCEFPRLDTEVLLAHVLGCRRIDLYGERHGEIAPEPIRKAFKELIGRRILGCPVAYLVGRKEFFSLPFEVTPAVLIPRPDTELVVVECLNRAKKMAAPRVLDVGTGSGNIAVGVASQHPGAVVTALDVSAEALAVAQANAARHGLAGRIRFLQGDLLAPLPPGEAFDFILSNPPYIASEDFDRLEAGVRDYEPRLALDGGPGGFVVFERLLDQARDFLVAGGYLMVEIGAPQEKSARERLANRREYEAAETIHDHSGHPRVLCARRTSGP
jgi:release factor glutamine methyltransferase